MSQQKKIAVVVFQLGGPDSLEAVEPFLYNLFCDPDIINFPGAFLARKALARFIASRRSKVVGEHYREIGGKSPIVGLTLAQASALENSLRNRIDAKVFVAMRYWHPLTEEAIASVNKDHYDKIVLLPLYPQFSKATTVSSMKEWQRQCKLLKFDSVPSSSIESYHDDPLYIEAIVENINIAYKRFACPPDDIEIVFSAHGIPLSLVKSGDPYQRQIEATVRLVVKQGEWKSPHTLCYQSKVGPAKWLGPSLTETIPHLAARGRRRLLVVPVAFVTEHIETLHEINIEARTEAQRLGIEQFEMMPALNSHPKFIQCLAELVMKNI
jgi:ferrochelatase